MKRFHKKLWLATPTMHADELKYVIDAFETNWMSTVGENINEKVGCNYRMSNVIAGACMNVGADIFERGLCRRARTR